MTMDRAMLCADGYCQPDWHQSGLRSAYGGDATEARRGHGEDP